MAPGDLVVCNSFYLVEQDDIDSGSITSTAQAVGTATGVIAPTLSAPDSATVAVDSRPALTVSKSTMPDTFTRPTVGSTIDYSYLVTNTGNVTLHDVEVLDDTFRSSSASPVACAGPSLVVLAPGQQIICSAKDQLSQVDIDSGGVAGTATATAHAPTGSTISAQSSRVSVALPAVPALTLATSASPPVAPAIGDVVAYSFRVTNSGNVTLTDIELREADFTGSGLAPVPSCGHGPLAPGQQLSCAARYTVTPSDLAAGQVRSTATATGLTPRGMTSESGPSVITVATVPAPALAITTSVDPARGAFVAGQHVDYSFLVTNTGNVAVTDAGVDDSTSSGTGVAPPVSCQAAGLAPGERVMCTAAYTLTQADVDSGTLTRTVTAHGTAPDAATATVSQPSTTTVTITPAPALTLTTSAVIAGGSFVVGHRIDYSFLVGNLGNVTLDQVGIDETDFSGAGVPRVVACQAAATSVAPAAQVRCTASYVLTQADVEKGTVTDTARAIGTAPGAASATRSDPSSASVGHVPGPALTLVASVDPSNGALVAGQQVAYSFLITNTGDIALPGLTIGETAFSGTGVAPTVSCPAAADSLPPGAQVSCTAGYTLTQEDVDRGSLTNTATAVAPGTPVSESSTTRVQITATPGLSLVTSARQQVVYTAGTWIIYEYIIRNTGNVTLTNVQLVEGPSSATGQLSVYCPPDAIPPGAITDCNGLYVTTQADIDAGSVSITAHAVGTPPAATVPVASADSTTLVPARPGPKLTVTLVTVTPNPVSDPKVGESVVATFVVTNAGDVALRDVQAGGTFSFPEGGNGQDTSCVEAPFGVLQPGDQRTCTATGIISQDAIDAGSISFTAGAAGDPPSGPATFAQQSTVVVRVGNVPSLSLVSSASPATGSAAGDVITYSFRVRNTGNVTVSGLAVNETDFTGTGPSASPICRGAPFGPGQSVTCSVQYRLTQADVDAGRVSNTAVATVFALVGTDLANSAPSTVTVPITPSPALTVQSSADPPSGPLAAGRRLEYSFLLRNTGNITLTHVGVKESAFSGTGPAPAVTCPADAAALAPTGQLTCTASYVLTQADVNSGALTDVARASGTAAGGVVSDLASVSVTVASTPALTVDPPVVSDVADSHAGDAVSSLFLITNTGNVTLSAVGLAETTFTGTGPIPTVSCPPQAASLDPHAHITCTAGYTLTQADVDLGRLDITAAAAGTAPGAVPAHSDPASALVTLASSPSLTLVNSVSAASADHAGDTVTYDFHVTNTGNVTLTAVGVMATSFGAAKTALAVTCPVGRLAPAASATCTATYRLTQADVDAGGVRGTVTAVGTPRGSGSPVGSAISTAALAIPADPVLTLVRTATAADLSHSRVGDIIRSFFVITNAGNVTVNAVAARANWLSGLTVPSAFSCPPTADRLVPGASVSCSWDYVVTAADITPSSQVSAGAGLATPPIQVQVKAGHDTLRLPAEPRVSTADPRVPDGSLPDTGADVADTLPLGFALLLAGFAILAWTRRRQGA